MTVAKRTTHHLSLAELRFANAKLGIGAATIPTPPRGVIVGECPSEAGQGRGFPLGGTLALFPWPAQGSGGRLAKVAGLSPAEWLGFFWRRNLFDEYQKPWNARKARERVAVLMPWIKAKAEPIDSVDLVRDVRVLLLGARVADAFGTPMWTQYRDEEVVDGLRVRVDFRAIPHPSGQNLAYNEQSVRDAARAAVLWAARKDTDA